MNTLVKTFFLILWIPYSLAKTDPPAQQTCQIRPAIQFNAALIPKLPKEWFVGRATLRTLFPEWVSEPKVNSCAPLSYMTTCQGAIYIERDWSKNGDVIKVTKAYSDEYDNIVEYWESQGLTDSNYFIYGGFGTSMTLHFRDGRWQDIPAYEFPDVVYHVQAREYAMTAFASNTDGEVEWVLYVACDEDLAWVEIAQFVIKQNKLHDINEKIDAFLRNNLLLIPQMVKLISVPFFSLNIIGFSCHSHRMSKPFS